jgi:beta-lactamase regulating signal transducer with metallopeptidase domain
MKTLLFSAVAIALFFGLYVATLRRCNLLRLRRFYLVGTLMVAMVIPFVSIETKAPQATRVSSYVQHIQILNEAPALQIGDTEASPVSIQTETKVETQNAPASWTWKDLLALVYLTGCGITFILLIIKLVRTFRYYRRSSLSESLSTWEMRVRILAEPDGNIPFSFLHSVFVNPEVFTDSELQQVLSHERAHIRQHHTADLLLLEAVKVFQWFNPLIYLYLRELKSVHEYLADEEVLAQGAVKRDYLELLYKQLCVGKFAPVGNSFRHFLTKKRIQMMNQKVKNKVSAWWLLLLIPIMTGLLLVNCHPKTENLPEEVAADEEVCENPDVMPEFPGGIQQYFDNLFSSMQYPEISKKYKMQGFYTIRFIVEKDGKIYITELDTAYVKWQPLNGNESKMVAYIGNMAMCNAEFSEASSSDQDKPAMEDSQSVRCALQQIEEANMAEIDRAFRATPACKPAMKDGQPVRCALRMPVVFVYDSHPDYITHQGKTPPCIATYQIDSFPVDQLAISF